MSADGTSRTYNSPLRERQADNTRRAILEAASELIVEDGLASFSMRDVAEEAGVSERTVYNHFATRQAVLDGLTDYVAERLDELGLQDDPRDIEDLTGRMVAINRAFDTIGAPARAMARLTAAQGRPSAAAVERTEHFRERFADVLDPLPPDEAERCFAMIRTVVSSTTWLRLREEFALGSDDTAKAIAWALKTLLDDLRGRAG